ncbi:MFS family permease [Spinactinospora alkalitolerans]|uniref:Putative proline/betaine transporter n=1 Tax=Spinactinospora alkalitolerans TaxID=687207 RepID=A0A852TYZ7_9ACTN|nr:MFS transporter [Spinactinospora alkalitolerans]NYE47030.1 MFS family permease [Spinactinospora alkalitolerans]
MTTTDVPVGSRTRRATIASFVGTAIEWYDFYIYGTASALVFARLFFPEVSPAAGTMASFAAFWVGFLARPLGGIVFGHIGDRLGRKQTLVVTLLMMGVATTGIGLLPTYAAIGLAAPLLLVALRFVQGVAVGGEWGGAVLMATESAPKKRRGISGMWVQQGSPAGATLATLVFMVVGYLPDEAFFSWGWRVPFLLSAVLVVVGLVIRVKVEESTDFAETRRQAGVVKAPLVEVLRSSWGLVLLAIGASAIGISAAYFTNTFVLSWTTTELQVPRQTMIYVLLAVSVLQFLWQPAAALIAQRVGTVRLMAGALIGNIVAVVPMFLLIMTAQPALITAGLALGIVTGSAYYAMLAGFLAQVFPANVRYTGISVAYQFCGSVIGGSTPLVAQYLLTSSDGSPWAVAGYYVTLLLLTVACVLVLARRLAARRASGA